MKKERKTCHVCCWRHIIYSHQKYLLHTLDTCCLDFNPKFSSYNFYIPWNVQCSVCRNRTFLKHWSSCSISIHINVENSKQDCQSASVIFPTVSVYRAGALYLPTAAYMQWTKKFPTRNWTCIWPLKTEKESLAGTVNGFLRAFQTAL